MVFSKDYDLFKINTEYEKADSEKEIISNRINKKVLDLNESISIDANRNSFS